MIFARSKKIMFTNNKGGVGKTTLVFNISAKLAEKGYKVCMVDLDQQCNLTSLAMGENFENNLFSGSIKNIYDVLKGVIVGGSDIDTKVELQKIRNDLYILPGSAKLSDYDNSLISAYGEAAQGVERGYFTTSAINRFLDIVGMRDEFDFFIIDTGPNLNLLNRVIILGSDYFVTPMTPDAFSLQGIESLGKTFEEWKDNWKKTGVSLARDKSIQIDRVLGGEGLFIGFIINSYNKYAGKPIKNNLQWIEKIPNSVKTFLSEKHSKNGLVEKSYTESLGDVKDFGQLAPAAQYLSKAVFELDPKIDGLDVIGTKESLEQAKKEIESISENMVSIVSRY